MLLFRTLLGIAALLFVAWALSRQRSAICLRQVGAALALQASIAGLTLYLPAGRLALGWLTRQVNQLLSYATFGTRFVFGGLMDAEQLGFVFALRVLPVIIFFAALIAVLYHIGVMPWVVRALGGGLQRVLGTTPAESLSATANIFVGQSQAPWVVRPYLAGMSRSELFAVMSGGLASVSGAVLAGYAELGVPMDYLIVASFMAAPGGLLFAKILLPEDEREEASRSASVRPLSATSGMTYVNVLDAAASGASSGLSLAANVGAMLLAFVSLIALCDGMLAGIGAWFGWDSLTLSTLLGLGFAPVAYLLGVPWNESQLVGAFIGQKFVLNEFVAYANLAPYLSGEQWVPATGAPLTAHSALIVSFALCGFANLSSIAILLGSLGRLVPSRYEEIARNSLLAVLAGSLSNLMSATLAGLASHLASGS